MASSDGEFFVVSCQVKCSFVSDEEESPSENDSPSFSEPEESIIATVSLRDVVKIQRAFKWNSEIDIGEVFLGECELVDEVHVVLQSDDEDQTVLEKVLVPVICLDRSKPSELSIEQNQLLFSFTFRAAPIARPTSSRSLSSAVPTAVTLSSPQVTDAVPYHFSSTTPAHGCEHRPHYTRHSHHMTAHRSRMRLWLRASDVYALVRSVVSSFTDSSYAVAKHLRIFDLLSFFLLFDDSAKLGMEVVVDLGVDALLALDKLIVDFLRHVDAVTAEAVRSMLTVCSAVFRATQSMVREQLFWKLPLRISGPTIRWSARVLQPVYSLTAPLVVDPLLSRAQSLRGRVQSLPLVGSLYQGAEQYVQRSVDDAKQIIWPNQQT